MSGSVRARALVGISQQPKKIRHATDRTTQNGTPAITMMMNRGTIAVASRLAKNASKTSTLSKSSSMMSAFLDQPLQHRTFLSSTPSVFSTTGTAAAAAAEAAAPPAAVAATKKKTRASKKTDEDKESAKANKNTIISHIAETHALSLAEAGRIMDTVTGSIVDVRVCVCVCIRRRCPYLSCSLLLFF
jgi:hypothetical protein